MRGRDFTQGGPSACHPTMRNHTALWHTQRFPTCPATLAPDHCRSLLGHSSTSVSMTLPAWNMGAPRTCLPRHWCIWSGSCSPRPSSAASRGPRKTARRLRWGPGSPTRGWTGLPHLQVPHCCVLVPVAGSACCRLRPAHCLRSALPHNHRPAPMKRFLCATIASALPSHRHHHRHSEHPLTSICRPTS